MKKNAWSMFALCASLLGLTAPASAEDTEPVADSSEAIEILKKADAAARKVRSVRFEAKAQPTGALANFVGAAEGQGALEGWDEELDRPQKFWSHVKTTAPRSEKPSELSGGGDGETYFLVDHTEKKGYEDIDPGVLGSNGQILAALGMAQFVHPTPFERDLGAEKAELQGKEEVAGVECYKIHVSYGSAGGPEVASTWSISTADFLPRSRVRHFDFGPQGGGTLELTLSRLEIDPKLEADLFKMKLPEGYEQIDDFAP